MKTIEKILIAGIIASLITVLGGLIFNSKTVQYIGGGVAFGSGCGVCLVKEDEYKIRENYENEDDDYF